MSMTTEALPTAPKRLDSLDAFRGLTIAGMILVNNPGTWSHAYAPLKHAEWHGVTPTDLVFPFFVFIVGAAIELSLAKRIERGDSRGQLLFKIATRALMIFAIGLFLNGFPFFKLATIRIPGVLQRIAVCYAFAAALRLFLPVKWLVPVALALLLGYWGLLEYVPAHGGVAGDLTKEGSLPSWVDRQVFGVHKYKPEYDPEGLLSTIPAIGTALLGVFAGAWLKSGRPGWAKVLGLIVAGIALAATGWFWDRAFPINKALWTSSFVAFTAGCASILLGLMYLKIDVLGWRKWSTPLRVFGLNPILAFVGSGLVARLMGFLYLKVDDKFIGLKPAIYDQLLPISDRLIANAKVLGINLGLIHKNLDPLVESLGKHAGIHLDLSDLMLQLSDRQKMASLLFALGYVLFWFLLMLPLFRRGVAVRV